MDAAPSVDVDPAHCTGCGRTLAECPGCRGELDPPRYCPQCGVRLAVRVHPRGWRATCKQHGEVDRHPPAAGSAER